MQGRNIAVCIILSIVTCGIYGIYWFVVLTDEVNTASGHSQDGTSGVVSFLLTLITCGIYGLYWAYKLGEKICEAKASRNMPSDSSTGVIYLLLELFGLGIITYALAQNELNKMVGYQG